MTDPRTCPKCRHAWHGNGYCYNMASDNDCECRGVGATDSYTPTTEEVRYQIQDGHLSSGGIDGPMFDRWLAAVRRSEREAMVRALLPAKRAREVKAVAAEEAARLLTAWANRQAESLHPAWHQERGPGIVQRSHWASGFQAGILHLAEQLQREDVIEAGAIAFDNAPKEPDITSIDDCLRIALAAMLAKIAEGEPR